MPQLHISLDHCKCIIDEDGRTDAVVVIPRKRNEHRDAYDRRIHHCCAGPGRRCSPGVSRHKSPGRPHEQKRQVRVDEGEAKALAGGNTGTGIHMVADCGAGSVEGRRGSFLIAWP